MYSSGGRVPVDRVRDGAGWSAVLESKGLEEGEYASLALISWLMLILRQITDESV